MSISINLSETDQQLLDQFIATYTQDGWQIINRSESSVQLKKPKQWSKLGLIIGFLGIFVYGGGLIILLLTLIDYLIKKDRIAYITAEDIRQGSAYEKLAKGTSNTAWVIIVVVLLILFAILIWAALI